MMAGERVLRACAALMPASTRDRWREEWLADSRHAHELAMSVTSVVRGAARATLTAQKEALLMPSAFSPRQLAHRGGLAIFASVALFVAGGLIGSAWSIPVWLLAILVEVAGAAFLARSASRVLGSRGMPWALFAASAACWFIVCLAVVETNLHFNAVDSGLNDSGVYVAMLVTGAAGVTAFTATIVLGITLLVQLHGARGPRRRRLANV